MVRAKQPNPAESAKERVRPREGERMPIEELAQRTAVTVRNLRAMHARGLLPAPELVGRKGFYTERHLARVRLVLKLQGRGFSLAAIAALLKGWESGSGLMDVMGLEDSLLTPGTTGARAEADVKAVFPELLRDPRALAKALEQELVVKRNGRYIAPDAELLDIVKQQAQAGFPLQTLLEDGDLLLEDVERIAGRFRQSFFKHVADRYMADPGSRDGLSRIAELVVRLRPQSVRLVSILLARALERGGGPPTPAPRKSSPNKRTRAGGR
jgi:DNA-binding transcriptional MerR regulator